MEAYLMHERVFSLIQLRGALRATGGDTAYVGDIILLSP